MLLDGHKIKVVTPLTTFNYGRTKQGQTVLRLCSFLLREDKMVLEIRFAILPEWLVRENISAAAKVVYAGIWLYSDAEKRKAFPSRARLSRDLNMSTSSIDRAIKELKEINAVSVKGRIRPDGGRSSNIYELRVTQPEGPSSYMKGGPARIEAKAISTDGEAITITNKEKPIKQRKRDLLFEEMCKGLNINWKEATSGELGKVNGALKQLREKNVTPQELKEVIDYYKKNWKVAISAPAIANNWSKLKNEAKAKKPFKRDCKIEGHAWVDLDQIYFCRFCKKEETKVKEDV